MVYGPWTMDYGPSPICYGFQKLSNSKFFIPCSLFIIPFRVYGLWTSLKLGTIFRK
jgi:hypothetical protein